MLNRTTRFVFAVAAMAAGFATPVSAKELADPNAYLIRPGEWAQGVGSYLLTDQMSSTQSSTWPRHGWYQIAHTPGALKISPVKAPTKGLPDFLADVAAQVVASQSARNDTSQAVDVSNTAPADAIDVQYLRVPGVKLRQGTVPTVKFSNGTLSPKLDHTYQLKLGDALFTLHVQNGLRGKNGAPYGEGALYTVGYGGEFYSYHLDGYGWDTHVQAVADVDGDGKPDFFISMGGNNSGYEAVLLSSKAKPGTNKPTATLSSQGC